MIAGLDPPRLPAPPRRRKTYLERETEAAAERSALNAIWLRDAAEADALEALEAKRQARRGQAAGVVA